MSTQRPPRVSPWIWLWGGPAIVFAQMALLGESDSEYRTWMRGELGLVENLTTLFLVGALACTLASYLHRRSVRSRLFGPFLIVMALGLFFFAGEEASWGQHWFGFAPPEEIAARNDQGEFNLHNDPLFEKFLDQLPRLLLTVGALAGGIAAIVRRSRGLQRDFGDPRPWGWVWPGIEVLPAAILALTVTLPKKAFAAIDRPLPHLLDFSPGETKEYCLALFLLVYFWSLWLAVRAAARERAATSPSYS